MSLTGWLQGHSDGLMCYIEDYTHDIDDCVGFVQHSKLDYAHSSSCLLGNPSFHGCRGRGIYACIYLAPDCRRACVYSSHKACTVEHTVLCGW